MHIVLISNHLHPVRLYGGTERVVEWLAKSLVSMGHRVTLIAKSGSSLPGATVIHADNAAEAAERIPTCDIVHFHGWLPSTDQLPKNYLYTLHGNEPLTDSLPEYTACISQNHANRHKRSFWVYNGVSSKEFDFSPVGGTDLLFFSKIRRRNKGAREAVDLCSKFCQPLTMAGGSRLDLIKVGAFWKSVVSKVSVLGEIGGAQKAKAFAQAKGLIFPIQWEEPFGLVLIESLLSGTPVLARGRGSVPELISESVGQIYDSDKSFGDALQAFPVIDRAHCRQYAIRNFDASVMARTYLSVYEQILSGVSADTIQGSHLPIDP